MTKLTTPFGIREHSVKDVSAQRFIEAYAKHLKRGGKFRLPEWVDCVKTGSGRELAPYNPDWLYVRASAILRHLYFRPEQGVNAFKTVYGNKKRRGAAPSHHRQASGGLVRYCLQQFESMGLVEQSINGGRRLTSQGQQEITAIAKQLRN